MISQRILCICTINLVVTFAEKLLKGRQTMILSHSIAQSVFTKIQADITPITLIITTPTGINLATDTPNLVKTNLPIPAEALETPAPLQLTYNDEQIYLMPLVYQTQKIGYLGLVGPFTTTDPLIKIVSRSANLILAEEIFNENADTRRQPATRAKFLDQWLHRDPETFSHDFILQGQSFGYDVMKPHRLMVLSEETLPEELKVHALNALPLHEAKQTMIVLDGTNPTLDSLNMSYPAGVSAPTVNLKKALQQAQSALNHALTLPIKSPVDWQRSQYITLILASAMQLKSPFSFKGNDNATDLLNTFRVYFENNGHLQQTADELHIHRNTLNYRLDMIHKTTKLDPRNYQDLIFLYIVFLGTSSDAVSEL